MLKRVERGLKAPLWRFYTTYAHETHTIRRPPTSPFQICFKIENPFIIRKVISSWNSLSRDFKWLNEAEKERGPALRRAFLAMLYLNGMQKFQLFLSRLDTTDANENCLDRRTHPRAFQHRF